MSEKKDATFGTGVALGVIGVCLLAMLADTMNNDRLTLTDMEVATIQLCGQLSYSKTNIEYDDEEHKIVEVTCEQQVLAKRR